MNKTGKKYGLVTAISMVVGSVIGSGIFFKAESISRITGGNALAGICGWVIGGIIMLCCLLMFARLSSKYNSLGIVDCAEKITGKSYAYYIGWFMATIYYPSMVSVLSYLTARYTLMTIGCREYDGGLCMLLSCVYLTVSFLINALLPFLSAKIQIVSTVIKLIPLILMAVLGSIEGVKSGILNENLKMGPMTLPSVFCAVTASAFAYEGWIAAMSIAGELKDGKKNLSRALVIGGITVTTVYVLYYIGISGAIDSMLLLNHRAEGIRMAYNNVMGENMGALLTLFVAVSCFGALNGLMLGLGRAMYEVSVRENGPMPRLFSRIDPVSSTPLASCVVGFFFAMIWLFFYFGVIISPQPLFINFAFDSSEIPIITMYAMYIPLFFLSVREKNGKPGIKDCVLAFFAIYSCLFMIFSAVYSHGKDVIDYLFAFAVIMLIGAFFKK